MNNQWIITFWLLDILMNLQLHYNRSLKRAAFAQSTRAFLHMIEPRLFSRKLNIVMLMKIARMEMGFTADAERAGKGRKRAKR